MNMEVVWNGTIDHAWAAAQHRPAPPLPEVEPACVVPFTPRTFGANLVDYLLACPRTQRFTIEELAAHFGVERPTMGTYVTRAREHGYLVRERARRGRQAYYRVSEGL